MMATQELSVCLKCGELKRGAWSKCVFCGALPDNDIIMTKQILASDHYLDEHQLKSMAKIVKAGQEVRFPPEALAAIWVDAKSVRRHRRSYFAGLIFVAAGVFAVLVATIYLLSRP